MVASLWVSLLSQEERRYVGNYGVSWYDNSISTFRVKYARVGRARSCINKRDFVKDGRPFVLGSRVYYNV